jgi:FkbM family methyltransferase
MHTINLFRTRSYRERPLLTLFRSAEWISLSLLRRTLTYKIRFGPNQFELAVQVPKRGFGSAGIFIQRQYYEPLLEFGYKFLEPGDSAIDGGANQGVFTCAFASAVGSTGHVFAFEPQSYAVTCIRNNVKLNKFENVTIFEGALSDRMGQTFLVSDDTPVSAHISPEPAGERRLKVATFSIDALFDSNTILDAQFIKLDVEGAELQTLFGAKSMLRRARPRLCIEALDQELYAAVEIFLRDLGYRPYTLDYRGNLDVFSIFRPCPNVFFLS